MTASAPMRVGVTGHRDLADPSAVAADVDRVLADLAAPDRSVIAVTSLADGADRVVAERVLARVGGSLEAVLPLAADDYATDFDERSAAVFRRLLAAAISVRVTGPDEGGSRESAYERAGRVVVESCDVLLALWDGEPARGRGGTAEIVDHARARGVRVVVVPVRRGEAAGTGPVTPGRDG